MMYCMDMRVDINVLEPRGGARESGYGIQYSRYIHNWNFLLLLVCECLYQSPLG